MRLRDWLDRTEPVVIAYLDEDGPLESVNRTLRGRTVENGFTAAEARAAAIKADELEGRLQRIELEAP